MQETLPILLRMVDPEELAKFNNAVKTNFEQLQEVALHIDHSESVEDFDKINQQNWFMPDEYKQLMQLLPDKLP